jgi:O-antigen/teichoic acid export membrane protein
MYVQLNQDNKYDLVTTLRHSLNYFISRIATRALGLISIPIMTRLLLPSDYGIVNVFSTSMAMFFTLMTLNASSGIDRYYYEEKSDFKEFFGTSVFLVLIVFSFFSIAFLLCQQKLAGLLGLPVIVIRYIPVMVLFTTGSAIFHELYVARRESKKIAVVDISSGVIGLLMLVIFLLVLPLEAEKYMKVIWASLVVSFFFFVYYSLCLKEFFKWSFKKKYIKYITKYCIPLIPYSLSGYILNYFDLLMVNSYNSSRDAGLYALGYKIGMLLQILVNSIFGAMTPTAFKYMNRKNYHQFTLDIDNCFRLIFCAFVFLVYFGSDIGMLLAGKEYHESLKIVPIIAMGYLFLAMWEPYKIGIFYSKKVIFFAMISLTSGVVNIVLNCIFIPRYGYMAAAFTTLFSFMIMAYGAYFINKRILKVFTFPFLLLHKKLLIIMPFIVAYYILISLNLSYIIVLAIKMLLVSILFSILLRQYFKVVIGKVKSVIESI